VDERLDFAKLVAALEERYCPDFGRPAIHPEVIVRALLICSLYNIASFRRLCSDI
jgi:transposase